MRPSFSVSQSFQTSREGLPFVWTAERTSIADDSLTVSVPAQRTSDRGEEADAAASPGKLGQQRQSEKISSIYFFFNFSFLLITSLPSFLDLNHFVTSRKSVRTEAQTRRSHSWTQVSAPF